jgi:hypothetical protein
MVHDAVEIGLGGTRYFSFPVFQFSIPFWHKYGKTSRMVRSYTYAELKPASQERRHSTRTTLVLQSQAVARSRLEYLVRDVSQTTIVSRTPNSNQANHIRRPR